MSASSFCIFRLRSWGLTSCCWERQQSFRRRRATCEEIDVENSENVYKLLLLGCFCKSFQLVVEHTVWKSLQKVSFYTFDNICWCPNNVSKTRIFTPFLLGQFQCWARFARNVVKWDFLSNFQTLWCVIFNPGLKASSLNRNVYKIFLSHFSNRKKFFTGTSVKIRGRPRTEKVHHVKKIVASVAQFYSP